MPRLWARIWYGDGRSLGWSGRGHWSMKGSSCELSLTVAYPLRLERHFDVDDVCVDGEVLKLW